MATENEEDASTPISMLYDQEAQPQPQQQHFEAYPYEGERPPSTFMEFLNQLSGPVILLLLVAFVAGLMVSRALQNNVIIRA